MITIKADTKKVERKIKILTDGVKDFKKPLKESGEFATKEFYDNFSLIGAKFAKWKPLKPATLKAKARMGYPLTPLIGTGRMMKSFKLFKLERFVVIVGNKVQDAYFKYHQLGGRKIPKRVMIAINRSMSKKIIKIFNNYIKKLLEK